MLLAQTFNPVEGVNTLRLLGIAVVTLALIYITAVALFGAARQGNSGKVARVLGAVVLALVPLAIAIGIGAQAFGNGILEYLFPSL